TQWRCPRTRTLGATYRGRARFASSVATGPLQHAPYRATPPELAAHGHPRTLRLLDRRGAVHAVVSARKEVHRDDRRRDGDHGGRRRLYRKPGSWSGYRDSIRSCTGPGVVHARSRRVDWGGGPKRGK